MIGPATLTPEQRAHQLGHPKGEVGRAVAEGMNVTNKPTYERLFRRLELQRGSRVLEVGFGNGRFLPLLMEQAQDIRYVGVDISETMVEEASKFNATSVAAGQLKLYQGSAEAIPCPAASFERAFSVAVIYFLEDPRQGLAEFHRVLRPGGRSIVASVHPETAASTDFARPEFGFRVYDEGTLLRLHREAGFDHVIAEPYEDLITLPDERSVPFRAYLVVAER